jgi:hypothetical protein
MKLGVCVPYRNREAHLKEFVPTIGNYLDSKGIEYCMYFGHQTDDKLFNRGAMKNIAAEQAFKDGCDYIVWHDIDMVPEEGCDYSFPAEKPRHIATQISQMNYQLKYEEYFGGAILFSKEQVEKTNGYSNDYWDWGMEDDDLFWRCVLEGYADDTYMDFDGNDVSFLRFNGNDSHVEIPTPRSLRNVTTREHTVSILTRAYQQEDKVPVYLIGDEDRRFVEYPILRRPGYDWGISYNNSRAYTAQLWNNKGKHLYQWMKRYEGKWAWITLVVDAGKIHFYMNGKESDARWGTGTKSPQLYEGHLKRYGNTPYYLGTTTSVDDSDVAKWFKGDIADIKMWNRALSKEEVGQLSKRPTDDGLVFHLDFEDGKIKNKVGDGEGVNSNCEFLKEDIKIPYTTVPHRVPGRMFCLEHEDEGLVEVGGTMKWKKGETTARNEKRYIKQMQQGEWDYKSDGMNSLKYELVSIEEITPKAKMINVKL